MTAGDLTPARRVDSLDLVEEPGDYFGPTDGYTGDKLAVFFIPPNGMEITERWPHGRVHHVTSPPHVFRECGDGSLEVRQSIGCLRTDGEDGYSWHGFLDEGNVWREV